jgi:hypothetical protein
MKRRFLGAVNFRAGYIAWEQVGGKLYSVKTALYTFGQGLDGSCFCETGCAFYQQMAIGQ